MLQRPAHADNLIRRLCTLLSLASLNLLVTTDSYSKNTIRVTMQCCYLSLANLTQICCYSAILSAKVVIRVSS